MNKIYALHFYFKGMFIGGSASWNKGEFTETLKDHPEAYLMENNEIHELWRVDVA